MEMGAIGALYYYFMVFYYDKGLKSLLAGLVMPVAMDGVAQNKMRLGAQPYLKDLEARSKFYFIPVTANPLTLKILKSNPLFYISGETLKLAIFLSAEDYQSKEDFFQFYNRLKNSRVEKTRIFCFDNPEKIIKWTLEENIAGLEFIKYAGTSDWRSEIATATFIP
jgi:hypothetical protein